jgi:hypothetical protein
VSINIEADRLAACQSLKVLPVLNGNEGNRRKFVTFNEATLTPTAASVLLTWSAHMKKGQDLFPAEHE